MRLQPPTTQIVLLATVLGMAMLGQTVVLYYVPDPQVRLGVGGLLLALIVLLSAKLGVVSRIGQLLIQGYKRRQFLALRSIVDEFVDEVRRLNWASDGARRGFRSGAEANQDMDAAEKRLHQLVGKIRECAGQVTPMEDDIDPEQMIRTGGFAAVGASDKGEG